MLLNDNENWDNENKFTSIAQLLNQYNNLLQNVIRENEALKEVLRLQKEEIQCLEEMVIIKKKEALINE